MSTKQSDNQSLLSQYLQLEFFGLILCNKWLLSPSVKDNADKCCMGFSSTPGCSSLKLNDCPGSLSAVKSLQRALQRDTELVKNIICLLTGRDRYGTKWIIVEKDCFCLFLLHLRCKHILSFRSGTDIYLFPPLHRCNSQVCHSISLVYICCFQSCTIIFIHLF